jgi:type VI secretion system secreted protein VgrG
MVTGYKNPDITVTASAIASDLRLLRMSGREGLGQLFAFEVDLASETGTIDVLGALNQPVAIALKYDDTVVRQFHGMVASFSYIGVIDLGDGVHRHLYRGVLRPKTWSLTREADCRIFQQKTAVDIIKQILSDAGLAATDYDMGNLAATYGQRIYCVQYRETDFNFISRLMEEEGIYYYFTHSDSSHTMVFCEKPSDHQPTSGYENVQYIPPDAQPRPDHLNNWNYSGEVQPGKYTIRDYNFQQSSLLLESASLGSTFTNLEIYDYPGIFQVSGDGETRVAIRQGEMAAGSAHFIGGGPIYGLSTGALFTLTDHPRDDQNAKYLIISATYDLESDEFREAAGKKSGPMMQCDFRAILSSTQYRPPRVAPKPFVQGPQTAVVVGPAGDDDICTDSLGRVKVQFFWDRLGKMDDNSSCWIRVASIWAGNAWGAYQLPRLKQEVIVDFLEGDPDQPIITGRVYNDANPLAYTMPDDKTKSWIKSRSTTQGTADNFNELRFEDKIGSEEIFFHAEKDFNREVENNDTLKVGFDKKSNGDQTITIYNNQTSTIGSNGCNDGSQSLTVWNNQTVAIGNSNSPDGSQTVDVWNNRTVTIHQGNEQLTVSTGNREVDVTKGNDTHKVQAGNREVDVVQGNDTHKVEAGNREVTVSQGNDSLTVSSGDMTVTVSSGKCSITAGTSITLTVGGSSIKIESAKITVQSAEIAISADAKVTASSPATEIDGSGTLTVKGGVVKIN